MATPTKRHAGDNPGPPAYLTRQPSRWLRNTVLLLAAAVLMVLAWTWKSLRDDALVASAYGARAGCACRFIARRPLETCEGDLRAAGLGRMGDMVSLSEDAPGRAIRAGVPLLGSQTAHFDPQGGCQSGPWND